MDKKTKILATIGPSSDSKEVIEKMILNGANVFRLNFSHGTHESHLQILNYIREASKKLDICVGVLQDICGPKIRVGKLAENFILKPDDVIEFHKDDILGEQTGENSYKLSINQPQILERLKNDEYIYLYDGSIRLKIVQTSPIVKAVVENHGILASKKGVNFPNTKIDINVITEKDKEDILWGIKNGVDFIAISFVQNANDVLKARAILNDHNSKAKLYAKIEKFDAVENIDEIIQASDGIMIARGDLGIEIPYYKVPSIQKLIIKKTNTASKPVITATQMLLSMAKSETATRAEISDVANAVLDGTDAVMLSEETAIGKDPVHVIETMANTIRETERIYPYDKFDIYNFLDETDIIASSTARLAKQLNVRAIISLTSSGKSAIKLARYRIKTDIFAITHDEETAKSLSIAWGVKSSFVVEKKSLNVMIGNVIKKGIQEGLLDKNMSYIISAGYPTGVEGSTNFIRYVKEEQIEYYISLADI